MELPELITIGGAATLTTILVQAIKSVLAMPPQAVDRFGLALAVVVGCVVTVPTALYLGSDPAAAALAGVLAGASSVGIYKGVQAAPNLVSGASSTIPHPFD